MTVTTRVRRKDYRRLRNLRRWLFACTPVVVWCVAIAAAFTLHRHTSISGTVVGFADDQPVTLAHLEPGVVREVYVEVYDTVVRGRILLTMDDREERMQLKAVEADIDRLAAEVYAERARLEASGAWATADVEDLARRFGVDREAAHVDYLAQLMINARDRIRLRGAAIEYEIQRKLYEHDNATFRELNAIQTEVDALREVVANNVSVLLRKKEAFTEADRRWGHYLDRETITTEYEIVLTPLRLEIEVRRRDLDEIVRRIDAHVLRAPVDGQVTMLAAHVGDRFDVGTTLVSISPTSTSRVLAYLPERMIFATHLGALVSVQCLAPTGSQRAFQGTIVGLSTTVTEAPIRFRTIPSSPVWGRGMLVDLDGAGRLVPGEAVRIAILGG